jgi:hypothetical protein
MCINARMRVHLYGVYVIALPQQLLGEIVDETVSFWTRLAPRVFRTTSKYRVFALRHCQQSTTQTFQMTAIRFKPSFGQKKLTNTYFFSPETL